MACSWPQLAGFVRLAPLCGLLALAGCASRLDVRTLATARADQPAFELTGRDLTALRREAGLLCPQGGEILRQTARDQRLEAVDSRLARWVEFSSRWITPPEQQAQMVVVCHPLTDRHLLAAAAAQPAASGQPASAASAVAPASAPGAGQPTVAAMAPMVPIGPVSVEW